MTHDNDLLPCPFCGAAFKMGQEPHDSPYVGGFFYLYHDYGPLGSEARKCPISVNGHYETAELAIAAWNRRALPAVAVGVPTERPDAPAHIVEYTNWRGETARRVIIPIHMWWGSTEWHPKEQWMLTAWDVEKNTSRDFAWQDMRPVQNPATSAAVAAAQARDAKLREAVGDMISVAAQDNWHKAMTGRQIILAHARAALSEGDSQ